MLKMEAEFTSHTPKQPKNIININIINSIFSHITQRSPLKFNQCFGGICRFHLQGCSISQVQIQHDAIRKQCQVFYPRRYISGDISLHKHHCESLNSITPILISYLEKGGAIPPCPPSWHGAQLIKRRDEFAFAVDAPSPYKSQTQLQWWSSFALSHLFNCHLLYVLEDPELSGAGVLPTSLVRASVLLLAPAFGN
jgi:hypothetical protein